MTRFWSPPRLPKAMKRKATILGSIVLAVILVLWGAAGITEVHYHVEPTPTITASPDVTLKNPEPTIKADSKAKLPKEARPEIKTAPKPIQEQVPDAIVEVPAPAQAPNYRSDPDVSSITPYYYDPYTPRTGPSAPLPQPVPAPLLPEPPSPIPAPESRLLAPVTGLVNPLTPSPLPTIPRLLK